MSFRTIYGYSVSENGWRMCNRDECVVVSGPGMSTAPLRRGAAEIILGDLVRRYHNECAPVLGPVWGWSATNDVGNSNHLAGTAVDINAPQWPWGYRTMGAALVTKITTLVNSYGGAVYWGRNWSRPDEMHFQLNWPEGDSRYAAVIAKIRGGATLPPSVPSTPSNDEDLGLGSSGQPVSQLQAGLNRVFASYSQLDVDGEFGPATEAVVKEFQRRTPGLTVDGIVGPATKLALSKWGIVLTPTTPGVTVPTDRELLERIAADTKEIRAQLGPGDPVWPKLGNDKSGKPLTLRNAIGKLLGADV